MADPAPNVLRRGRAPLVWSCRRALGARSRTIGRDVRGETLLGTDHGRGRFHSISGHGDVSESGAIGASISIDTASLDTGNRRRDEHLRTADFFDADAHPSVVIATTRVEPGSGAESWSVTADVTAAAHTEPVELDVDLRLVRNAGH